MEYIGNSLDHTLVSSSHIVINERPLYRMETRNTYPEKLPSELVFYESFGIEVLTISPTNSDSTSSMLDFLLANSIGLSKST